ncbi:MAG: hypothetical protein IKF68_01435, partial [Erysipelotrichaceae bacterium]|nr:hypothetical protein [Erysipelotrichaceae bacterium]
SLLNFVCYYYEDLLYMNGFMMTSRLPRKEMAEVVCRYEHERPKLSVRFLNTRKELVIPELREYSPAIYPKERSIMFQIRPGITMSLAMLGVAGINIYSNYLNGQPLLNSLVYILMPLTMLVSGILWPLLARSAEQKTRNREESELKNSYLEYLQEYENRIIDLIKRYLKQERSYYFEGTVDKEKIFNITKDDPSFLQISIGTVTEKRELNYKDPGNADIRAALEGIRHRLQNIVGCPFFLDLRKYRTISICTERSQKINMLKKVMLELSYKYYYDDLYLALYSEDLDPFADLFGLPQLIYANTRLTLNRKS